MATFRHSGKLGDIIYSLPTVRALGGGELYLNTRAGYEFYEEGARAIIPLLDRQPYIEKAAVWQGESIDYDLDRFRQCGSPNTTNLADAHLLAFNLPATYRHERWLMAEAHERCKGRAVFARSLTHHGVPGFWAECMRVLRGPIFVGTATEHERFQDSFGQIEYWPTADLLDLTGVIAGCSVFIGNQSCPYAIAEGLKAPVIQETDPPTANCIFERPYAYFVRSAEDLAGMADFVSKLQQPTAACLLA